MEGPGVDHDDNASAGTSSALFFSSSGSTNGDGLFAGMKFWLSALVPDRQNLLARAQLHGAEIVKLEKQADVRFVDHARKHQPPGTHSYLFIEESIRNGKLARLEDHAVGPASRVDRPVGSRVTAPRRRRVPFTEADDRFLWEHVAPLKRAGGDWKGNEIYKQLEDINPRHTFQSWRDRFLKYVETTLVAADPVPDTTVLDERNDRPHTPSLHTPSHTPSPHTPSSPGSQQKLPPTSSPPDALTPESQRTPGANREPAVFIPSELRGFPVKVANLMYIAALQILTCSPEECEEGWSDYARHSGHPVEEMKALFNEVILPKYYSRHPQLNMADAEVAEEVADEVAEEVYDEADDEAYNEVDEEAAEDVELVEEVAGEVELPKTCSKCMTTQSRPWYWHPKRGFQCSDCGSLSKKLGVLRPSTSLIDGAHRAHPSTRHMVDRASSPIRLSFSASHRSPPRPVSASPSQHTPRSPTPAPDSDTLSPIKRLQTPPAFLGKRKRPRHDPDIEIPPTPEQREHESPKINLVNDRISTPISTTDTATSDTDASSVYQFDTAPAQSADWDTAPDEEMSRLYETAPTSPADDGAAQSAISITDWTGDDFDLPPPDGGWDSHHNEDAELDEPNQEEVEYASWKAKHRTAWWRLDRNDVDAVLLLAIVATSFDFDTADLVVKHMIELYKAGHSVSHLLLPDDMPGCWTTEDDKRLLSGNIKDLVPLRNKHGTENCSERMTFLDLYNQA
ncbi:hypothetical protein DV735_g1742, partial [Chaetothyriales sp. CBS 134920]